MDMSWLLQNMMGAKNAPFPEPTGQDMPASNPGAGGMGVGSAPPGAGYPFGKGVPGGVPPRQGGGRMGPGGGPAGMVQPMMGGGSQWGGQRKDQLMRRRQQLEQERQSMYQEIANLTQRMGMLQGEAAAGNPMAQAQVAQVQAQIEAVTQRMQALEVEMQQLERDFQEADMEEQRRQERMTGGVGARSDGPVRGYFGRDPGSGPMSTPFNPSPGTGLATAADFLNRGKSGGGGFSSSGGGGSSGGSRPPQYRDPFGADSGYVNTPFTSGVGSGSGSGGGAPKTVPGGADTSMQDFMALFGIDWNSMSPEEQFEYGSGWRSRFNAGMLGP